MPNNPDASRGREPLPTPFIVGSGIERPKAPPVLTYENIHTYAIENGCDPDTAEHMYNLFWYAGDISPLVGIRDPRLVTPSALPTATLPKEVRESYVSIPKLSFLLHQLFMGSYKPTGLVGPTIYPMVGIEDQFAGPQTKLPAVPPPQPVDEVHHEPLVTYDDIARFGTALGIRMPTGTITFLSRLAADVAPIEQYRDEEGGYQYIDGIFFRRDDTTPQHIDVRGLSMSTLAQLLRPAHAKHNKVPAAHMWVSLKYLRRAKDALQEEKASQTPDASGAAPAP